MKTLRLKANLTQEQLGIRVGLTQAYISKIEKGNYGGLTINKLIEIAHVLQVTPVELFEKLLKIT